MLDRAIRIALAERAPTVVNIPSDVQELEYSAPTHAFKMVPSSIGVDWPTTAPDDAAVSRAAEVLNAGRKVAILAGSGACGTRAEVEQVAELLGTGVAKPLLGEDVLSDELPYVTCRCRKPVPPGQMLRWSLAVQPCGDCVGVG